MIFFVLLVVVVDVQCMQSRVSVFSASCKSGLKMVDGVPFRSFAAEMERKSGFGGFAFQFSKKSN